MTDPWEITDSMVAWIFEWRQQTMRRVRRGPTLLELGSGSGTSRLVDIFGKDNVCSIEHDVDYCDKYHDNYILAPLKKHKEIQNHSGNLWYDARVLERELPDIPYDIVLVDGPCPPGSRAGFVKYFNIFRHKNVTFVFDDLHRYNDWKIIKSVASRLEKPFTVYGHEGKNWGVILP